jgi:uncharacterized protein YjbI with pentapeptide repeats
MADPEHLAKIMEGVEAWNQWRKDNPEIIADLEGAPFWQTKHEGVDLRGAHLGDANLKGADLERAKLSGADLRGAKLERANLRDADIRETDLRGADFRGADLRGAKLRGADLREAKILVQQLSKVTTLYQAQLEPIPKKQIRRYDSHLLNKPEDKG